MKTKTIIMLKNLVLFVLIVAMLAPTATKAAAVMQSDGTLQNSEATQSLPPDWQNWADLSTIPPLDIDLSQHPEMAAILDMQIIPPHPITPENLGLPSNFNAYANLFSHGTDTSLASMTVEEQTQALMELTPEERVAASRPPDIMPPYRPHYDPPNATPLEANEFSEHNESTDSYDSDTPPEILRTQPQNWTQDFCFQEFLESRGLADGTVQESEIGHDDEISLEDGDRTQAAQTQTAAPRSIPQTPLVVNPFSINFSASESAAINTGAAMYRTHILSLPGRGGFGFNLDLLYSTQRADFHSLRVHQNPAESTAQPRHNLHGLGVGWIFDLPYIIDYMLYIPGRGSFAFDGETIVGYYLYDMRLRYYNDFRIGHLQSTRRLDFLNGTSYFFHYQHIIGMQDRFGNTIRFYYVDDRWSDMRLLSQIVDSAGSIIDFYNQAFYDGRRRVTITAPDASTYVIYMSPRYDDIILTQVHNQAGNITSFEYQIATFDFQFIWQNEGQSRTALLRYVRYQSGASLSLGYGRGEINLGVTGSRFIYRLTHRALLSNGREYLRTDISYLGDHTGRWCASGRFNGNIDRPVDYPDGENRFIYAVIITQNNGVVTEYTFNSRHLNEFRTINTPPGTQGASSAQFIRHNDNRLPYFIWLSESYSGHTRETIQRFEYNRYGQATRVLSPKAHGHDIWHYWTRFYYDNRFGLLHRRLFWADHETEIDERNYFCQDGKHVIRTNIRERGQLLSRTEFVHDRFGNVIETRAFPHVHAGSDFIATHFSHVNGFSLPSTITVHGIRDFYGNLAEGGGTSRTHFLFDAVGRTVAATDPNGYTTTWEYDSIGRITRINHPNGGFETFTYNDYTNAMYHRTLLGAIYRYHHDPLGNLLTITVENLHGPNTGFCCCNAISTNTFDTRMRLVTTHNIMGLDSSNYITYSYDVFDRVVDRNVQSARNALLLSHITIRYYDVYDSHGNKRIVTTQLSYEWETAPCIVTFTQFDRYGRLTQEGTQGGRIITYTHDIIGRVIREQSLGIDNNFTHNIHGITHVTNILGDTARNNFDHMGRLTRSYDFRGYDQRFHYDALSRLIRHYKPILAHTDGRPYHTITTYQYDRGGNLIRTATLVNRQHSWRREWAETVNRFSHNRLMSSQTGCTYVHSTQGITAEYTYDLAGNVITKRVGGQQVMRYDYDNRGRIIATIDAMGLTERFTYCPNGHLQTRTDRNGVTFMYTFDGMERVRRIEAEYDDVSFIRQYTYNLTGSIQSRTETQIHLDIYPWVWQKQSLYHYDAQGRVIRQDKRSVNAGNTSDAASRLFTNTYIYNEANNIISFATLVEYMPYTWLHVDYDIAQRPIAIRTIPLWGGLLATYTYDANNNRTSTTLYNGVVTEYIFNPGNMVASVVNRVIADYSQGIEGRILSRFEYTYFLDGNVHTLNERFEASYRNRVRTFDYDSARRLIREEMQGVTWWAQAFSFDARGNRAAKTVYSLQPYTVTYTYDLNNRLVEEHRQCSITDEVHVSVFSYDNNGNQLTVNIAMYDPSQNSAQPLWETVDTRVYNLNNQLTEFTSPHVHAQYTYWANGLRSSRTISGQRIYQVWNQGQIVLEVATRGRVLSMHDIALVVNHRIRGTVGGMQNYYLTNARGDVAQRFMHLHDGIAILHNYQYDAFGNEIWLDALIDAGVTAYQDYASPNPFRFAGEHLDFERGEYYLRARSFSPRLGRFTQPDPHWNVNNMIFGDTPIMRYGRHLPYVHAILQASNLYVFTINNPVQWVDPSGLKVVRRPEKYGGGGTAGRHVTPAGGGGRGAGAVGGGVAGGIAAGSGGSGSTTTKTTTDTSRPAAPKPAAAQQNVPRAEGQGQRVPQGGAPAAQQTTPAASGQGTHVQSPASNVGASQTHVARGTSQAPKRSSHPNSIYEQVATDGTVRNRTFFDNHGHPFARQDFDHPHFDRSTRQFLQPHEHRRILNQHGQPITPHTVSPLPLGYSNMPTRTW